MTLTETLPSITHSCYIFAWLSNAPAKLRRACAAYHSATDFPRAASFSRLLCDAPRAVRLPLQLIREHGVRIQGWLQSPQPR